MIWIDIKKELPVTMWESSCCQVTDAETSILIFGYDHINFCPRYRVMFINDVAAAKPEADGRYIINELIVTHWMKIERP